MKTLAIVTSVLVLVTGVYATQSLENSFVTSSPKHISEGISNQEVVDGLAYLDFETATKSDIVKIFGEPLSYVMGDTHYSSNENPSNYIMIYSDYFHIFVKDYKIMELRFYSSFYEVLDGISVGTSKDEVLGILGEPVTIVIDEKNNYEDNVFYQDINGEVGFCYYSVPEKNIRMFFTDNKVNAIYQSSCNVKKSSRPIVEKEKNTLVRVNTDNINLPFVNDEEVIGKWQSVDFVWELDQFTPGQRYWSHDSWTLNELEFLENGKFEVNYRTWTKGFVMHHGNLTASAYILKDIDDETYMFFEWKNGDYVYRNQKPAYYVLKKVE